MSDNFAISTASGERTIASDQISEVDYVRNKLVYGPDGTNTGDVQLASATAGGLPVQANQCSDYIMVGGVGIAIEFGTIALTATGTVETPTSGKRIRILSLYCEFGTTTGDEIYTFKSGAAGTVISAAFGTRYTAAGTFGFNVVWPFNPGGWMQTATSALLELSIAGTTKFADGNYSFIQV